MLELETRSFEARFGDRCPFCNKTWGDPSPCGDSRADRTIKQSLGLLFADRKSKNCDICDRFIPSNRTFCWDCSASREKARNQGERHIRFKAECLGCGGPYERRSDKKGQRYCSTECRNASRVKQFCKRGHDTTVVGRDAKSECIGCRRERQRKVAA